MASLRRITFDIIGNKPRENRTSDGCLEPRNTVTYNEIIRVTYVVVVGQRLWDLPGTQSGFETFDTNGILQFTQT